MNTVRQLLLVDDEAYVLKSVARAMRKSDWQVSAVSSAREALALMQETDFHVVISDYRMPGMDGIEFLSLVTELYPRTLQVLLSGNADLEDLKQAVNNCQIQYFMTKPWDVDELQSVARQLMDEAEYMRMSL